jgi:DNA-binding CsgD family transcriptional regulator
LIRLQSSNKEMANMLGITLEGVKKAKQRLRKKMNLDDNTTIEDAILKI